MKDPVPVGVLLLGEVDAVLSGQEQAAQCLAGVGDFACWQRGRRDDIVLGLRLIHEDMTAQVAVQIVCGPKSHPTIVAKSTDSMFEGGVSVAGRREGVRIIETSAAARCR